jgi:hypothetical protein
MSENDTSKINNDGLRYSFKPGGSPFGGSATNSTMSCYKCGHHKPRTLGIFKKLAGKNMFMCQECVAAKILSANK